MNHVPDVIQPDSTVLLVVDYQDRLLPAIHDTDTCVEYGRRMIEALFAGHDSYRPLWIFATTGSIRPYVPPSSEKGVFPVSPLRRKRRRVAHLVSAALRWGSDDYPLERESFPLVLADYLVSRYHSMSVKGGFVNGPMTHESMVIRLGVAVHRLHSSRTVGRPGKRQSGRKSNCDTRKFQVKRQATTKWSKPSTHFGPGTQLVKATSSTPGIEILASTKKTFLINKRNTQTDNSVNGQREELKAYEVHLIETPLAYPPRYEPTKSSRRHEGH